MSYFLVPVLASYPMKIGFGSEQLAVFFFFFDVDELETDYQSG